MKRILLILLAVIVSSCAKHMYTEEILTVNSIKDKKVFVGSGDTLNVFKRLPKFAVGDTLMFRYVTSTKIISRVCPKDCPKH